MTPEELAKVMHTAIEKDVRMFGRVSEMQVRSLVRKVLTEKDEEIAKLKAKIVTLTKDKEEAEKRANSLSWDVKELQDAVKHPHEPLPIDPLSQGG